MKTYKGWKVGDFLRTKQDEPAYYSGYGGRPEQSLFTWQTARVSSIAPKVKMSKNDKEPYFLVVDFIGYRDEMVWRAGVSLDNAVKATKPDRYVVA